MRVLVLSDEDSTGQTVQAALARDCDIVLCSPGSDMPAASAFDAIVLDESVSSADAQNWVARLAPTTVLCIQRPGRTPAAVPTAGWNRVKISGRNPPTRQDVEALRQALLLKGEHSAQIRREAHETDEPVANQHLQAVLEATGAKVISFELTGDDPASPIEQWILQSAGGPRQDPKLNVHPVDLPRLRQAVASYLTGSSPEFDVEFRVIGRSGQWEWVQQRAINGHERSEHPPRHVLLVQTSHTAARRAANFQERQAQILDRLVAGDDLREILIFLIEAIEENYTGAIATVARLDEAAGKLYHMAGPSLPPDFHAALDGLLIGPQVGACGAAAFLGRRVVLTDMRADESCRPYRELFERFRLRSVWSQPIVGSEGNVIGTFAIYHREMHGPDAGEVRLIETAANLAGLAMERWGQIHSLLQVEKRFLKLADLARLFPWDYDVELQCFTYLGPQVETILGYTPKELLAREKWMAIIHPDDLELIAERAQHPEQFGENFSTEYRVLAREGRVIWLHGLFSVIMQAGKAVRLQGFSIDITDRKVVESAQRESEERYRILADYSSDIISRLDPEGRFLYVSPACRALTGYEPEQLIGRCAFDFIHPEDLATVHKHWASLATEQHALGTYRTLRADGSYVWFETRGQRRSAQNESGFEVIATSRDVTEQVEYAGKLRDREAELAHAERLATMGQMAAELAHELNQPLQAISNFAEAGRHWLDKPTGDLEPLKRWNNQISQQSRRAAEVVRRILNFVRKGELDREPFDLTSCVQELRPLLDVAAKNHRAKIDYQLSDGLSKIVADRLLIEQVVVNLFRNALEAMADQPVEERVVIVRTFETADQHVGLSITDRGRGLDTDEVQRLFEPYFTTKSDGTGMGLAICRSTIDAHEGRIWAVNNEQGGATFSFVLPLQSPFSAHRVRQ